MTRTATDRARESRQNRERAGARQLNVMLPAESVATLDALARGLGMTRSQVVIAALDAYARRDAAHSTPDGSGSS